MCTEVSAAVLKALRRRIQDKRLAFVRFADLHGETFVLEVHKPALPISTLVWVSTRLGGPDLDLRRVDISLRRRYLFRIARARRKGVGTQNGPRYTLRFCRAFDGAHLAKRSERGGWRIGIGPEVIAGEIDMLPTER